MLKEALEETLKYLGSRDFTDCAGAVLIGIKIIFGLSILN